MDHGTAGTADSSARALGALALISTELNSQLTLRDVKAAVLHAALVLNDAAVAAVAVLDGAGSVRISTLARRDLPPVRATGAGSTAEVFGPTGRAVTDQIRAVIRRREPVAIDDLPAGVIAGCIHSGTSAWMSDLADDSVLGPVDQALGHPVRDASGAVVAVLAVGWTERVGFAAEVRAVTELFCDLASSGLVRARHAEELTDLANRMRTALLPARTDHGRLDIAYDYVPALDTIGFGGDWFDVVEPGPNRVVLVVGDIAGHGVPAAARMALAQGVVRALVGSTEITEIPLRATSSLAAGGIEMLATLGIVDLDLGTMRASCQLAGHPPPMLRRPDGTVVRLGDPPLPPVGMVRVAPGPAEPTSVEPGSLLVLYTDGLIERRGSDLSDRLGELESSIAALPHDSPAAEALETICEDMLTDASEDDVAILVVKVLPDGDEAPSAPFG